MRFKPSHVITNRVFKCNILSYVQKHTRILKYMLCAPYLYYEYAVSMFAPRLAWIYICCGTFRVDMLRVVARGD